MSDVGPPVSAPSPESSPETSPAAPASKGGAFRETWLILRNRVLSGLFLALPLLVTAFVIKWTYDLLSENLIAPIARLVLRWWDTTQLVQAESWVVNALAPIVAIVLILSTLFLLGMFFRSRVHRLMDWVLLQVPVVRTIYSAVMKVIDSIQRSGPSPQFQRVVLVTFPHPGAKVPGFVTSTCVDRLTGKTILCVYCPTTPVPTSGFMLLVPEEDVFDISWDVQDTVQAIVSGGISMPQYVEYFVPGDLKGLRSPAPPSITN